MDEREKEKVRNYLNNVGKFWKWRKMEAHTQKGDDRQPIRMSFTRNAVEIGGGEYHSQQ